MLRKVLWCCFLLGSGCVGHVVLPPVTGAEYFPLGLGYTWLYQVSETTITEVGGQSIDNYQLRVTITDTVRTGGQLIYIWMRERSSDGGTTWQALETWSARLEPYYAIIQQGNVPFVKISMPVSEGKSWDGNALNTLGGSDRCADGTNHCDNYTCTALMKRYESTGLAFNDALTVEENNSDDALIGKDIRTTVYGRDVGIVYREETVLEYCTVGACIGKQQVTNGHILKMTIVSHAVR